MPPQSKYFIGETVRIKADSRLGVIENFWKLKCQGTVQKNSFKYQIKFEDGKSEYFTGKDLQEVI